MLQSCGGLPRFSYRPLWPGISQYLTTPADRAYYGLPPLRQVRRSLLRNRLFLAPPQFDDFLASCAPNLGFVRVYGAQQDGGGQTMTVGRQQPVVLDVKGLMLLRVGVKLLWGPDEGFALVGSNARFRAPAHAHIGACKPGRYRCGVACPGSCCSALASAAWGRAALQVQMEPASQPMHKSMCARNPNHAVFKVDRHQQPHRA